MAQHTVKVELTGNRLSFHVSGPRVAKANTQLLNECLDVLMECAEKNGCFDRGLSALCLETIANHDKQSKCITKAFGFATPTP